MCTLSVYHAPRVSSWDRRVGYSRSFTLRAARALKEKSFKRHLTNVQFKTVQRREVSAHSTLSTAAAPKAAKPGNTRRQHAARAPPTRATDQIVLHAPGGPGDVRDRSDFYSRFDPRLERPHFSNVGPPTERRPGGGGGGGEVFVAQNRRTLAELTPSDCTSDRL